MQVGETDLSSNLSGYEVQNNFCPKPALQEVSMSDVLVGLSEANVVL